MIRCHILRKIKFTTIASSACNKKLYFRTWIFYNSATISTTYLEINSIRDAPQALNGLQIQNRGEIKKIGLAVDLCQATIELAIKKQCQMLFVHHGAFWSGLQPSSRSSISKNFQP